MRAGASNVQPYHNSLTHPSGGECRGRPTVQQSSAGGGLEGSVRVRVRVRVKTRVRVRVMIRVRVRVRVMIRVRVRVRMNPDSATLLTRLLRPAEATF